ncbi:hypothetical protein SARC_12015 [Sphaeroforma arctica JP610]|uniref:Pectinacetylesterase n=1 Tax=Sphaeroforma arctica JP610 TaxID=667725 RepID=A0A0L0FFD0_9EUKA|nr:hypothetical protein SARC_12015 [Sphaeroforma arctica JP610]KNC75460.1 hypothetical protein SARC_12015 [Sphaeroforma arctica JP610]|eukprot:XP_014149362.1 hypothetical protein SARC_12015 [Sphaeroforma arctica JP610]
MKSTTSAITLTSIWLAAQTSAFSLSEAGDESTGPSAENLADYEICENTGDQDCNYAYLKENLPEGKKSWIVAPDSNTVCLDGSPFGFLVFPGTTDRVMLWFQGGGACYDYETCVAAPTALTRFSPNSEGYFNYDLEGNPLASGGWTSIVNNCCSGDMFIGDATRELTNGTHTETVHFAGYNNTLAVLNWMQAQSEFPVDQEIASGGCSAGSLGVQVWADYLVRNYGVDKLQPDSYIGMLPREAGDTMLQWNACGPAKAQYLEQDIVDLCEAGGLHEMPPVFNDFLAKNPEFPVAYTGSAHDIVQRGYYALLTSQIYTCGVMEYLPGFAEVSLTFSDYLWTALTGYNEADVNYSYYIVDTTQHSFVVKDDIVSNEAVNSPYSDLTMWEYVGKFLNEDEYQNSPSYPAELPPTLALDIDPTKFYDYIKQHQTVHYQEQDA